MTKNEAYPVVPYNSGQRSALTCAYGLHVSPFVLVTRMPSKFERLICDYCTRHGISVPSGFARLTPSRFAIIRIHLTPPKLIAKTWYKAADVHYYIENFLLPELGEALPQAIQILDFKDGEVLSYTGSKRLASVSTFSVSGDDETG